jgi:putative FmdB family regulatory protein
MPIYEYKCEQTGKVYEFVQSIKDAPLEKCNLQDCECNGQSSVHRVISKNVGVIFNGNGFYETDYKHHHDVPPTETTSPNIPAQCCGCEHSHTCGAE